MSSKEISSTQELLSLIKLNEEKTFFIKIANQSIKLDILVYRENNFIYLKVQNFRFHNGDGSGDQNEWLFSEKGMKQMESYLNFRYSKKHAKPKKAKTSKKEIVPLHWLK